MKPRNPLKLLSTQPKDTVLFATSQLIGERDNQEDFVDHYLDECFALADGVGGMPHGDVAARVAVESAIWGYKLIRQRRTYWQDKRLFIKRIFRSANISVFQKQREPQFREGLATTLVVGIIGGRNFWLGSVGDSSVFLYRNGSLKKLTTPDIDEQGYLTKIIGTSRYGLTPQFITGNWLAGDALLLVTDGVTNFISEEEIEEIVKDCGHNQKTIDQAARAFCLTAQENGSPDNMSVVLVKRTSLATQK